MSYEGASVGVEAVSSDAALTRQRIQEYVWARYVDFEPAPFTLDEAQAAATLEAHYREHAMSDDSECFYYGILAYELAFADERNRRRYLVAAVQAFEAYRQQTSPDFAWDVVEDRYQHARDELGAGQPGAPA